jgi:hypothetical protein
VSMLSRSMSMAGIVGRHERQAQQAGMAGRQAGMPGMADRQSWQAGTAGGMASTTVTAVAEKSNVS